jgi:hypothetical protein
MPVTSQSRLIVIEGPDGVGKAAVANELVEALRRRGVSAEYVSFPTCDESESGCFVHQLQGPPEQHGTRAAEPASALLRHVAAHLDLIAARIRPALAAGRWVVLDRYWWSTWVHGKVAGVGRVLLDQMIEVERAAWADFAPSPAVLLCGERPLHSGEPPDHWQSLVAAYRNIASGERSHHPVTEVANEIRADEVVARVLQAAKGVRFRLSAPAQQKNRGRNPARSRATLHSMQPDLFAEPPAQEERRPSFSHPVAPVLTGPYIFLPMAPAKPSKVYQTYWRFAAKRQEVFFRRLEGVQPLTDDPILLRHKFTNAYRASDRVSQYLIREVIYQHEQSLDEVFFRTILFKLFNKIETWELLVGQFGVPRYADYSFERYAVVLDRAMAAGHRIYSAAYIMPSGSGDYEDRRKHRSHLRLLERMMADRLPSRIAGCKSMRQAFELIGSYPMIGDFLAYQFVTDVNYGPVCNFSEMDFVVPGPGARDGIRKCFLSLGGLSEPDIIRWVAEHQQQELERLGIEFRSLWGRPLQLIDCQNLFCEVDKYARLAHPDVQGISGRIRIKQVYRPNPNPIRFWYPPKWGINSNVEVAQRGGGNHG